MLKIETVEETIYLEVNALEGYARKEYVDNAIAGVNSSISNIESNVSAINSELEKKANKGDLEGLATERYVDEKIDNIPEVDLTPYATKVELEEKADISYVDDKIAGIKIPSIEGLATEQYVDNKVSSIDLSEYALTSDLSSAIGSINSDLDLKADKTELEGLATEDYVNEKVNEKEIGITEPELVSKSVGSDKWMREGAYGYGGVEMPITYPMDVIKRNGLYRMYGNFGHFNYGPALNLQYSVGYSTLFGVKSAIQEVPTFIAVHDNGKGDPVVVNFLTSGNTFPDSNGVLHNSSNPIDTLNTSDMADTVVDNDLLTVTSGAVYRAITELQNRIDELEGQVNELKALYEQ